MFGKSKKKYKLIRKFKLNNDGRCVYRIKALRNFDDVKKGDLGGFVESEENLSHYDNCWIYNDGVVYGNARVRKNAKIYDRARVMNKAEVSGNAYIYDDVKVRDSAWVYGDAEIHGTVSIEDSSEVYGCVISGELDIIGNAVINKDIDNEDNYITIGPFGSRDDVTTFINTDDGIYVNCGCFSGTIEEFKDAVIKKHRDNKHSKNYLDAIEFVTKKFNS